MRIQILLAGLMITALLVLAACGGRSEPPTPAPTPTVQPAAATAGDAEKGKLLFQGSCSACHGPEAEGVTALGKSLHPSESEMVRTDTDEELVEFIKLGRQPDHPDNTTGVAMPPKGGNPAISDADLYDIVAWIRTLQ
jgi:mono/diheme cytochrome c family protein